MKQIEAGMMASEVTLGAALSGQEVHEASDPKGL